jgi:hypothetical protein
MVTNEFGCSDSAAVGTTVSVLPLPAVSFVITDDTHCENDPSVALTATPSGGTFSGTAVSSAQFDPAVSGTGTFYMQYAYTGANGCTSDVLDTITVLGTSTSTLTVNSVDSYTLNGQSYTSSGTYQQIITNVAGCDSTITLILDLEFTGLNELDQAISIHPNPGHGIFNLRVGSLPEQPVKVMDASGRVIKEIICTGAETIIDLNDQPNAVYYIQVDEYRIRVVKIDN